MILKEPVTSPQDLGNSSTKLAKIVRNGGQPWAGSYLNLNDFLNFSSKRYITLKIWTEAPAGTDVQIKLEQQSGSAIAEQVTKTTTSGEWETLHWDFSYLGVSSFDKIVFMFDINNIGDGTSTSTFYFDDVQQIATLSNNSFFDKSVKVYPNPVNNILYIKSNNITLSKIEIFTILGRRVKVFNDNLSSINLEDLTSGVYLIKIHSNNGQLIKRLVKK